MFSNIFLTVKTVSATYASYFCLFLIKTRLVMVTFLYWELELLFPGLTTRLITGKGIQTTDKQTNSYYFSSSDTHSQPFQKPIRPVMSKQSLAARKPHAGNKNLKPLQM